MRGVEHIPWLYDATMWLAEACGFSKWRRWLVSGACGRTLEVGCGTGRNFALYPRDLRLVGLEPDMGVLLAARSRAGRVPLVLGRTEALPFRDQAFDTVVSGLVFCSVAEPLQGLSEVRRVLQPTGQLRMLEHVLADGRLAARWQRFIEPAWIRITGGCHLVRDTVSNVEASGFQIERSTRREQSTMRLFFARPHRQLSNLPTRHQKRMEHGNGTLTTHGK